MFTCQMKNIQHKIEEKAKLLNDTSLLCKISAIGDFIAKEIKYHRSCQQEYADRAKSIIRENNKKNIHGREKRIFVKEHFKLKFRL